MQGFQLLLGDSMAQTRAQTMAVLQSYRVNHLGLQISHSPERPAGMSETFYKTARGWGEKSLAENIAWARGLEPSSYAIKKFINQFMDDSSETPFNLGHRTSLLLPSNSAAGYGIANAIGVMEIDHDQSLANRSRYGCMAIKGNNAS